MRWHWVGPALAVVTPLVVGGLAIERNHADQNHADRDNPAERPVQVRSDAPRLASLEGLVHAADVVVRAHVVTAARGRVFGEPGGQSIESRLVTLEVAEVLAGTAPAGAVIVEEEGWLEDGAPLVVDGAAPSTEGDDGIWFLVRVAEPDDVAGFVVLSAQGRYLVSGAALEGAAGDDPLIRELSRLSVDELAARVLALGS